MTGSIYASGLISGIDTASLVSQLIALERRRIDLLEAQMRVYEARRSAYQKLNTALLALKTKAAELAKPESFQAVSVTSSQPTLLSTVAATGTPLGTYAFTVEQMATQGIVGSNAYADPDTPITSDAGRTITVNLGSSPVLTVSVEAGIDTLSTIADKINAADAGVTAFVLNDGAGHRLMIQSDATGAANEVTIAENVPGMDFTTVSQAQDAVIKFGVTNPVTITSSDNVFEDVVPGLTLTVLAQPATPTQVNVDVVTDTEAAKTLISEFVDAYNRVNELVRKYSKYDAESGEAAALFGEGTVRMLQSDLAALLTTVVSAAPQPVNSLMAIGISPDAEGGLVLDAERLDAALAGDFAGVQTLFTDTSEGIGVVFSDRLDFITRPADGVIYTVTEALDATIADYEERISALEDMLALREEEYRRQFTAMEEALAALRSQSQFLWLQMANMSGLLALLGA